MTEPWKYGDDHEPKYQETGRRVARYKWTDAMSKNYERDFDWCGDDHCWCGDEAAVVIDERDSIPDSVVLFASGAPVDIAQEIELGMGDKLAIRELRWLNRSTLSEAIYSYVTGRAYSNVEEQNPKSARRTLYVNKERTIDR